MRSECIRLLRAVGCNEGIIKHCNAVAELALEIARRHRNTVNEELILRGALLHDIGRTRSHGVDHGFVGGEIARELGLEESLVRIIQRHVGAGITAEEAKEVGLPPVDLIPETMEEKIVAHADNLIDSGKRTGIEDAIADLKSKLGETHPSIKRMIALHKAVMKQSE
ncbi:MAG: TIGR00295 family protein [Candidatus Methanospirareceae archaeon]